jgi:hypothetical protein
VERGVAVAVSGCRSCALADGELGHKGMEDDYSLQKKRMRGGSVSGRHTRG